MKFKTWLKVNESQLPDTTFMGWDHFIDEINKFINKFARKTEDGLHFVTLRGHPSKDVANLHVYLEPDSYNIDPNKMMQAVHYFVTEMGMKVLGQEQDTDPMFKNSVIIQVGGMQRYEQPAHHSMIKNSWMRNSLLQGRAIDVHEVGVEVQPGVFKLNQFIPDIEYVDARDEEFIRSIGKDRQTGEIYASIDTRFYKNDDYECLWLR